MLCSYLIVSVIVFDFSDFIVVVLSRVIYKRELFIPPPPLHSMTLTPQTILLSLQDHRKKSNRLHFHYLQIFPS